MASADARKVENMDVHDTALSHAATADLGKQVADRVLLPNEACYQAECLIFNLMSQSSLAIRR